MWFNSYLYLAFLPAVLLAYTVVSSWRGRKLVLLAASYVFYACWNPPFVLLLLGSSTVDYFIGQWIARSANVLRRRLLVAISCTLSIGILVLFKYAPLLMESFDALVRGIGLPMLRVDAPPWVTDIVLPVGISFYTFQGITYIVDVYRGRIPATQSYVDFLLFVAFFPQLVAGPILRAEQFMPQLEERRHRSWEDWDVGLSRISLGLFQKVALADNIAPLANLVFDDYTRFGTGELWIGVYAFALQIYFDFAGYSNIAIGSARLFGFRIPDNFNLPYLAAGFRDFWRRWHISLSSWLRDYLYVPLGGNQHGTLLTYRNLLIVMFLGGLWHGASWSFALWGVLHGGFLIGERLLEPAFRRIPATVRDHPAARALGIVVTFHLVCLAWVPFRMPRLQDAASMMKAMLLPDRLSLVLAPHHLVYLVASLGGLVTVALLTRFGRRTLAFPPALRGALAGIMMFVTIVAWGNSNEFIYFQF